MKELLGFKDEWWDDLLEIVEHALQERGYKRFSQRLGREDFTYWKSFEGYQIGIKFYDFRKYFRVDPEAENISITFSVRPGLEDGYLFLDASIPLTIDQLEKLAEEFYKFTQSALSDDEMDGSSEICEPESCLYCALDGPWRNGMHVIGCPNGMLS